MARYRPMVFFVSVATGWIMEGGEKQFLPSLIWCDRRFQTDSVMTWVRESNKAGGARYMGSAGYSSIRDWRYQRAYLAPVKKTPSIHAIGDHFHVSIDEKYRAYIAHVDADYWKSTLHNRLSIDSNDVAAITLYATKEKHHHMRLVKQFMAERQIEEFIEGRGTIFRWEVVDKNKSHWLDCGYNALAALHLLGARVIAPLFETQTPQRPYGKISQGGSWTIGR